MSTNSLIGIQNPDGSVRHIYCHWDGYISHNGKILLKHYTVAEKINQLIDEGACSVLGANVGMKHDFNEHQERVDGVMPMCTFYRRDRGDTGNTVLFTTNSSRVQMLQRSGQEYNYLFVDGEWLVHIGDKLGTWHLLKEQVENDNAE